MPASKKPVEHLQAKPYNPHEQRSARRPTSPRPPPPQSSSTIFVQRYKIGKKKNPLLGYLLLFLITALLATALIFGFLVLLTLIAVLLPVWIVVRLARNKGAS